MAVVFDAASESHTGTTGSISQASFTWNHTFGAGSNQGCLIFIVNLVSSADDVEGVTVDGVTTPFVTGGSAISTDVEPGRCSAFFLPGPIASGVKAIVINRTNNADELWACAVSMDGDTGAALEVYTAGIVLLQGAAQALAVQSVTDGSPGTNSLRFAGCFSGLASPPGPGTGSTAVHNFDTGNQTAAVVRETTAGQGARNVGFTGALDDAAAVHLAIREAPGAPAVRIPRKTPYPQLLAH